MELRSSSNANKTQPDEMATETPKYVFVSQPERTVRRFSGREGHHELEQFLEDVKAAFAQRPDQDESKQASFVWSNLSQDVRQELKCQRVDEKDKDALIGALTDTYGDQRSLGTLALIFHSVRQEGYEGVRQYSTRLHVAFTDLVRQQKIKKVQVLDEGTLRDHFIEGLRETHLKISLRQHLAINPKHKFEDLRQRVLTWQPEEHIAASCSRVGTVESPADSIATSIADKFMPILEEQTKLIAKTTEENRECKKMMEARIDNLEKALADLRSCSQGSRESSPRQAQLPPTGSCYVCGRQGHYARECTQNNRRVYNRRGYAQSSYQQHRESGNDNPQ